MKKFFKLLFSRFPVVALTIIALFLVYALIAIGAVYICIHLPLIWFPPEEHPYINLTVNIVTAALGWLVVTVTILHIVNRDMVPETKIPWILCVMILNVLGVVIYITFSSNRPSRRQRRTYRELRKHLLRFRARDFGGEEAKEALFEWAPVSEALYKRNPAAILRGGTKTKYFSSGEDFFEALLADLRNAEKYIFLEYFIIEHGKMWGAIHEILKEKVFQGVEVRLLYDDIGSMAKVSAGYYKKLQKEGIYCVKFNPFVPVATNVHNNRDHRKITVIDGTIGYTGGINLADEYINETHPFGHWKDSAVRLEGSAVKDLTLMFLHLYNLRLRGPVEDFTPYIPASYERYEGEGYVQVYGDGPRPLYASQIGEDTYLDLINFAKKSLYITTPYLIIDYRLQMALVAAAARGVDVKIIVPHIPDKKLAFALTRSNYLSLIKGGVHIYEYLPGFIHAKSFLVDGEAAVVGTINLDYRSLMHHYENAVFMVRTKAVEELKADMEETLARSALQTEEDAKKSVVGRGLCEIAKAFAPLF